MPAIALALGLSVAVPGPALVPAQGSWMGGPQVVVNGRRLSPQEIGELARIACTPIPNGNYWLRPDGIWGYAGNPQPQGHIRYCCANQCQRPSLSERGMLFGPRDLWR